MPQNIGLSNVKLSLGKWSVRSRWWTCGRLHEIHPSSLARRTNNCLPIICRKVVTIQRAAKHCYINALHVDLLKLLERLILALLLLLMHSVRRRRLYLVTVARLRTLCIAGIGMSRRRGMRVLVW